MCSISQQDKNYKARIMIRKTLLTIIALLTASAADAQIPEYTELKEALNEKSLPLVNLSVDIEDVSKAVYTDATMEIADPLRRTDGESTVTTFCCKVKYRGASSLRHDKKSFTVKLLNADGGGNILMLPYSESGMTTPGF